MALVNSRSEASDAPEAPNEPFEDDAGRLEEHVLAEGAQDLVDRAADLVILLLGQPSPVEALGLFA